MYPYPRQYFIASRSFACVINFSITSKLQFFMLIFNCTSTVLIKPCEYLPQLGLFQLLNAKQYILEHLYKTKSEKHLLKEAAS